MKEMSVYMERFIEIRNALSGLPYIIKISLVCMALEMICKDEGVDVRTVIRDIVPIVDDAIETLGEI